LLNILQSKELLTTKVYVDFENIYTILKKSGKDPLEMGFFEVIRRKTEAEGMSIIDLVVFGSFEQTPLNKYQTVLRKMGLETRHSSNNGKNCSDMELTVNVLRDLYKNKNIEVFVIISSDRDIIPLLKSISSENKISYVFSTKSSFNPVVMKFATFHEYLENLFDLGEPEPPVTVNLNLIETAAIDPLTIDPEKIERAREVANYFYKSKIWQKSLIGGNPVRLKGYLEVIMWVLKRPENEIMEDFQLGHALKYITLYEDSNKGLCIKEGALVGMFIHGS